ncbi:tetracycline resistance MFS efflux pump [Viridibacillus sp. FSL R5-0477]|uniref:Multidrug-efflux transporter n=1 Tax=Viridibacillus arenosi FSL R5-213 TaxID=1227360 RepID=W4EZN2_9BACL|nr:MULTISPECIES: tetracycline resistance MFS efflux pump [Viridibacillus]ETT85684.1 multidrug-efflux transporter [Viridibacillus arenosi FSL R5-213]OMC83056.1 tetracycline resistance MFS efflux pump [Viridibacillus sp. FSL H8-0123]OMC88974.1 tetracycline resistance MFS efflux pump [Viridibacillus sp. FSL H7-0596]OMC93603.1 tetracycline resistance MFS efflux pump [Viridibacillus arenosi]
MKSSNKLALILLMFNMFITMSAVGLIIPVMPTYLKLFGAAGQVLGFLIAIIAFAQFLFSPIAGNLSDKIGRKKLIVFGLILNGIAQISFGLSTELWMLFVCRFLTGVGSAFIVPPIMAYVADITTIDERGKAMGLIGAAISLGFMIGPGIGGFLSNVSLHFPFYFAGSASIIAGVLSLILLPATTPIIQNVVKGDNIFKQLTRSFHASYFVLLIVVFVFSFGISNFQATLSMFLTYKFSYTATDIAILMTVGGFVGVIVQGFALNKLFKKFGEMKIILFGLAVASISMLGILFVSGFFIMLLVATIFSTATTLIRPAVNTLISKTAGNEQGFAAGMNNAYMSLGNMIGPALAGILFDWNMNSPYVFGTIILVSCFSLTAVWAKRKTTLA